MREKWSKMMSKSLYHRCRAALRTRREWQEAAGPGESPRTSQSRPPRRQRPINRPNTAHRRRARPEGTPAATSHQYIAESAPFKLPRPWRTRPEGMPAATSHQYIAESAPFLLCQGRSGSARRGRHRQRNQSWKIIEIIENN